jgi:hypothetical protein
VARTTKLTPERQERIVQAVLAGNYFETACRYAGISEFTGHEWMARGEGRDQQRPRNTLYAQFAQAVRLAEAQCETAIVAMIRRELPDNGRLGLEFLARRFPSRWSPRNRHEVSGPDGGEIPLGVRFADSPATTLPTVERNGAPAPGP